VSGCAAPLLYFLLYAIWLTCGGNHHHSVASRPGPEGRSRPENRKRRGRASPQLKHCDSSKAGPRPSTHGGGLASADANDGPRRSWMILVTEPHGQACSKRTTAPITTVRFSVAAIALFTETSQRGRCRRVATVAGGCRRCRHGCRRFHTTPGCRRGHQTAGPAAGSGCGRHSVMLPRSLFPRPGQLPLARLRSGFVKGRACSIATPSHTITDASACHLTAHDLFDVQQHTPISSFVWREPC
jgi:hypothetical protein